MKKIAVIGAGISGLTLAYRLRQLGAAVHVYEAADRCGGVIVTENLNGSLVEWGPNLLLTRSRTVIDFLNDLGLSAQAYVANPCAKQRYIYKEGQLIPVPLSLLEFVRSPLLSSRAKFRLLKEPFIGKGFGDESLADFVRRRLGSEFLANIANPFVAGVYAGKPELLSTLHAFPKLWQLEQDHGSLAKGALFRSRQAKKKLLESPLAGKMVSFSAGLNTLVSALTENLRGRITLNKPIEGLWHDATAGQYQLIFSGQRLSEGYHQVALTTPASESARILGTFTRQDLAPLKNLPYAPLAVVSSVYQRRHIAHPLDGYGVLVPEQEQQQVLGILFRSSLFPGQARPGHAVLSTFLGGARQPELLQRENGELIYMAQQAADRWLGTSDKPKYCGIKRWPQAIPQYSPNHGLVLALIQSIEAKNPGLVFSGNYRSGISVPDCIDYNLRLAQTLMLSD